MDEWIYKRINILLLAWHHFVLRFTNLLYNLIHIICEIGRRQIKHFIRQIQFSPNIPIIRFSDNLRIPYRPVKQVRISTNRPVIWLKEERWKNLHQPTVGKHKYDIRETCSMDRNHNINGEHGYHLLREGILLIDLNG